jgi:hypothetical protein
MGVPPEFVAGLGVTALFPLEAHHIADGRTLVQRYLRKPRSTVDAVGRHIGVCVCKSARGGIVGVFSGCVSGL